jgi:hypothetical protein
MGPKEKGPMVVAVLGRLPLLEGRRDMRERQA